MDAYLHVIRPGDPTLSDLIRETLGDPLGRPITSLDDLDELLAGHPYAPESDELPAEGA